MIEFYEEIHGFGEYQRIYYLGDYRTYTFSELHKPKTEEIVKKAKAMYAKACTAHRKKHGDRGSCVLGNGIYIAIKRPRFKHPFKMMLCAPVGGGQSDSASYACKDPVLKFLKDNGIEAWYEHGRMD